MNTLIHDAAAASLTACFIHALVGVKTHDVDVSLKAFIGYADTLELDFVEMSVSDRLVWRSCVSETGKHIAEDRFVQIIKGTPFLTPENVEAFVAHVLSK